MTPTDGRSEAERRREAGDLVGAAEGFEREGLYLEAALAWGAAGERAAALADFVRIPPDHPRYREGCVLAITLAHELDQVSLALDNFLSRFLRHGPEGEHEVEAFEKVARLYAQHGLLENAAEVYGKLSVLRPQYAELAERLSASLTPAAAELADLPPLPPPPLHADGPVQTGAELGPPATPVFHLGTVIAGRYRLEERIGVGGMAVVFRATDLELNDEIAVKVFTQLVVDPESDARLRRELMLSRQLVHHNVVRVFEMGLVHGLRFLTLELLRGHKLTDRLRDGVLALDEGLDYLAQACDGLQAAHDLGVIHRDVKPGNLFIATGGVLKVMDFGLAKVRHAPGLTSTGVIGGTPAYMAPEQASDFRSVTPASDIYALGVVAFEMFTALLPFRHENPLSVLIMHREAPPPAPTSINPALPRELEQIILRCLEKDPSRRFGSCRELGKRIAALRGR
jgi:hypothetical protein